MPALEIIYCALLPKDNAENTTDYQNSLYTIFKEADTLDDLVKELSEDEIDSLAFVEKQGKAFLPINLFKFEIKNLKNSIQNTRQKLFYAIKKTTLDEAKIDNITTFLDGETLYGIYASVDTITELKNAENLQLDPNTFLFVSSSIGIENGFEELANTTILGIRRSLSGEI